MSLGKIEALYRYPVKGLPGQPMMRISLTAGRPIAHDRRFAVCNGDIEFEEGKPHWVRRGNFLQVASNANMVTVSAEHRPEEDFLRLECDGEEVFAGHLGSPDEARRLEAVLSALVPGDELRGATRLVEIPPKPEGEEGQAFADTPQPHISIINLGTVRAVAEIVGASLDERRFRGNIYIEAPPWSEFEWIGRTLAIGDARLEVTSRIGRCAATNVNPVSGVRDQNLPQALRRSFGHADCGIYTIVTRDGEIEVGASLDLAS